MRKPAVQWTIAVLITLTSAVWQRMSGPTYPLKGSAPLAGQEIALRLERSYSITGRQPVTVTVADAAVTGTVEWRRFPTSDPWSTLQMTRQGDRLETAIPPAPEPLMPMAGKLEYRVTLTKGAEQVSFPDKPAVTRFKGDVPAWVLVPHVAAMFFGMLFATRAAMAALFGGDARSSAFLAFGLLVFGGLVLGPVVQKLAFGEYLDGRAVRLRPDRQQDADRHRGVGAGGHPDAGRPAGPGGGRARGRRHDGRLRHPAQRVGVPGEVVGRRREGAPARGDSQPRRAGGLLPDEPLRSSPSPSFGNRRPPSDQAAAVRRSLGGGGAGWPVSPAAARPLEPGL